MSPRNLAPSPHRAENLIEVSDENEDDNSAPIGAGSGTPQVYTVICEERVETKNNDAVKLCSQVDKGSNVHVVVKYAIDIRKFDETTLLSSRSYKVDNRVGERR